ncbi:MAG: hypothetical protein WD005_03225 [Haliea sp.]
MTLPEQHTDAIHPTTEVTQLFDTYDIPAHQRPDLVKSLENAAAIWRLYRAEDCGAGDFQEVSCPLTPNHMPDQPGPKYDPRYDCWAKTPPGADRTALRAKNAGYPNKTQSAARRTRDDALQMWIVLVGDIWENQIGRPFDCDVTSTGEPVSEAARFCVDAHRFVDAECQPSRITKEMLACVIARRNRAGRVSNALDDCSRSETQSRLTS